MNRVLTGKGGDGRCACHGWIRPQQRWVGGSGHHGSLGFHVLATRTYKKSLMVQETWESFVKLPHDATVMMEQVICEQHVHGSTSVGWH